ncbi:hypothetical protein [Microbulbifer guangxiensis]|uniref:hypothetical protein n=1 Tax=Microbulbifer guangxiensis TaxID=2904249 RepID=UPI001F1F3F25|nr:hypothetical protein [Microbulbifer guangxiensis]
MKRIGMFAVPVFAALALQGCIFLPAEAPEGYDPFFFDPDEHATSADFVEVGNFQPNSQLPPAASRHCDVDADMGGMGSACWFFPVMRVY